ncbi:MAG: trypsin-like peptidase domain-containing protein [Emcibacteraceae bacterium]|nr:trypsin-like peptidase domain-containing protein [Emcibacteraceae bacterium]
MNIVDRLSVSVVPLEIFSNTDKSLAKATGFFYADGEEIYLVSNWHVLSGRNPQTGQPHHNSGAIPHSLSFPLMRKKNHLNDSTNHTVLLVNKQDENLWLQDRGYGQRVDVAVLKLDINLSDFANECTNLNNNANDLDISAGIDVFVLGYPLNQSKQRNIPVWKKASIASEPYYPLDDHYEGFLIDCSTREGMSGAPVIARQFGFYLRQDGEVSLKPGIHSRFLGIYSGRYTGNDLAEMQLGIVWKEEHIQNIISDGVNGNIELLK